MHAPIFIIVGRQEKRRIMIHKKSNDRGGRKENGSRKGNSLVEESPFEKMGRGEMRNSAPGRLRSKGGGASLSPEEEKSEGVQKKGRGNNFIQGKETHSISQNGKRRKSVKGGPGKKSEQGKAKPGKGNQGDLRFTWPFRAGLVYILKIGWNCLKTADTGDSCQGGGEEERHTSRKSQEQWRADPHHFKE